MRGKLLNRFKYLFFATNKYRILKSNFSSLFIIFVLFNILLLSDVSAQTEALRFIHRTKENGLSQNYVNSIIQDCQGFIWIGTNEGLNKYDGYEFKIFEKGNTNGMITDDWIRCVFEDSDHNIWVGTGMGGLNKYDKKTDKFTHIKLDSILQPIGNRNDVRSILEDKQKNIWFIAGNTIDKIDYSTKKIQTYVPDYIYDDHSNRSNLSILFMDSYNNLWFGTENDGLGLFDIKKKTFKYFRRNPHKNNSISDNDIRSIYEDSQRNLWIGTYNGGFNLFNRDMETFTNYIPIPSTTASLTVKSILEEGENKLWIGTRNGLFAFYKKTKTFTHYVHNPYNTYSLTQNNIQVIYKDSKENLWFGTKIGINILNKEFTLFTHYRADAKSNKCLNSAFITSIFEDSQGYIWFGTTGGGLNKFNRKKGTFLYYIHDPQNPYSISSNDVNAIIEDKNGNLWIGTSQGGLNFFNRKTNRFNHFKLNPYRPFVYQQPISAILYNKNNQLWIGTDNGLFLFDIKTYRFKDFPLIHNNSNILITCMIKGKGDIIWAGTGNSMFFKINKSTLKYKPYHLPTTSNTTRINSFLDDNNFLWVGTSGGGLLRFNKGENKFTVFTKKEGLANNFICGILKDKNNNLWISTSDGLSKFNLTLQKFINFYKENGLQDNQFTRAFLKTYSGKFFMGDINGAISFSPEKISLTPYTIPVVLTDFKIFNNPVKIGGEDPILKSSINQCRKIFLSYNKSSFTFTFAALDYTMSDKIKYAYKMKGFENNWNYVQYRRYATYTNLDPGNYTFIVKASNNMGIWSDKTASVTISISPPYWDTWWFRFLVLSLVGLILWHFAKYNIQKKNLLKATALAHQTQLKLLRNQMNPHFLLNVFSVIRALVLIDKKTAWEMISKLSEFFRYVLLNYSKEKATLNEEIEAVNNYISIQKICFHESLVVAYKIDDNARELIVPSFIFQPLVENAIKYGSQTSCSQFEIKLNIDFYHDILIIDVANTGRLLHSENKNSEEKETHGTSIKNIMERLDIMFKNNFTFQLYENENWVHAIIKIKYKPLNEEVYQTSENNDLIKELS